MLPTLKIVFFYIYNLCLQPVIYSDLVLPPFDVELSSTVPHRTGFTYSPPSNDSLLSWIVQS